MKIKHLFGLAIVSIFQIVMPFKGTKQNRGGVNTAKPSPVTVLVITRPGDNSGQGLVGGDDFFSES
jgi:hypothetical protein